MNELIQLLKDLDVPAVESKIFVKPLDGNMNLFSGYQQELDLEINSKETE